MKDYYDIMYHDPTSNSWKLHVERVFSISMAETLAAECSDKYKAEMVRIYKLTASVSRVPTVKKEA